VLEQQDGNGALRTSFVFGADLNEVVSLQHDGLNYWLHADDKRSVRRVTDASGKVVESYNYDEFGNPALFDGAGNPLLTSAVGNPYLYTGHQYDPETGFYYARNRYYDARTGRFISRDPAGAFGDPFNLGNAFTYAANNPATYVDPLGLSGGPLRPGEFIDHTGTSAASELLRRGGKLSEEGAEALAAANRLNDSVGKELMSWYDGYVNGTIHLEGATAEEGLVQMALSPEEAVSMVNTQFGRGANMNPLRFADYTENGKRVADWDRFMTDAGSNTRQSAWFAQSEQEIASLEQRATQLAQKGSRLKTAGKVLGVAGVALQSGMAMKQAYDNCAGVGFIVNEGVATAGANALVMAIPPLGVVDLVTGGSVSGIAHNGLMVPTAVAHLAGRMTGRDADNIRSSMRSSPATRLLWSIGEWIAGD
jgi:RHS repeat-associated protein